MNNALANASGGGSSVLARDRARSLAARIVADAKRRGSLRAFSGVFRKLGTTGRAPGATDRRCGDPRSRQK
ncbi:MAG TPA: hypothetical protein VJ724_10805 [Tahibacter sp.]|nr:hypothetical protein [Tahibacter sp.]